MRVLASMAISMCKSWTRMLSDPDSRSFVRLIVCAVVMCKCFFLVARPAWGYHKTNALDVLHWKHPADHRHPPQHVVCSVNLLEMWFMCPGGSEGKDVEQTESVHWHAQLRRGGHPCRVQGLRTCLRTSLTVTSSSRSSPARSIAMHLYLSRFCKTAWSVPGASAFKKNILLVSTPLLAEHRDVVM